jgi:hypothetical protein
MRADEIGSTHLPLRYCDARGIQADLLSDECLEVGDCAKQHLEIQRARVGIDTPSMIFILLSFNCARDAAPRHSKGQTFATGIVEQRCESFPLGNAFPAALEVRSDGTTRAGA